MRNLHLPERLTLHDAGWCLRSNRLCARSGALRYFAAVSRLGDGVFWYALMGALVAFDGMAGLNASLHLALTGLVALVLYKILKRWTTGAARSAASTRRKTWPRRRSSKAG